jgi:hypothetical protein
LCAQLLKNSEQIYGKKFDNIIYCYNIYQPHFKDLEKIAKFHEGVFKDLTSLKGSTLYILDDLYPPPKEHDKFFRDLHIQYSHHYNITIIMISHNCFYKQARTLSLSTHYFFLMKAPRDKRSIVTFGSQVCPNNSNFFLSAYNQATEMPYSYMLCDMRQETNDLLRYSSNALDAFPAYYVPTHINLVGGHEITNYGQEVGQKGPQKNSSSQGNKIGKKATADTGGKRDTHYMRNLFKRRSRKIESVQRQHKKVA